MPEVKSQHNVSQRDVVLGSIRRSLGAAQAADVIAAEYAAIPRGYAQSSVLDGHGLLELFTDRLLEYDAGVYRIAPDAIAETVAEVLTRRGKRGMAIPVGIPAAWLPQGFAFAEADAFTADQLDRVEGMLSGCTVAIAETGSIVLQNAAAQGPRILSLVPDYHLCVVFAEQVVATVPEAFARLAATASLPTTFISGPSATADIEMTRIKGVHGPRFVDVVLVGGP
jgi:L-lactate dehydrogenase complex protein LldG